MIELHHYFKIPNKLKDLGIYQWLFTSQENISHYMPPNPDERIHHLPMKLSKNIKRHEPKFTVGNSTGQWLSLFNKCILL